MTEDPALQLMRTLSGVLDIRAVFARVSTIANQMVPHDCLELACRDASDRLSLHARSTNDGDEVPPLALADGEEHEVRIVGDLRRTRLRLASHDSHKTVERIVAAGYRSLLTVRGGAHDHLTVAFLSRRLDAYTMDDEPAARRIAEYLALAVSHGQLAEAEQRQVEARVRAERVTARVQVIADGRDRKTNLRQTIGQSVLWRDVLKKATQVAPTEATVFLQGESGTGKEVVARFIHEASSRRNGPFVALNCAALPDTLLESELFGYERGAFTGAQLSKPGQVELACGGVLFLDEVSEMSPAAQAKFLRVLQEREFQRLGGTRILNANVRVIAATNRDLHEAVARGVFREDLYYRLQVFDIHLPPLRERSSDIPLLADAFLHDIARSIGCPRTEVTCEAMERLVDYSWPGNVRQLRNVLERATILCDGGLITSSHLSLPVEPWEPSGPPASITDLNALERRTIEQVMHDTDWNKSKAAGRLGLTRTQLYVRLRKYELERPLAS